MMEYKGYKASVDYDDDAGVLHGEVIGLRDVVTFQGASVKELRKAFRDSVDDYLEFCAERGEAPEKACSGRFVVRVEPALHSEILSRARAEKTSLNAWIKSLLHSAVS